VIRYGSNWHEHCNSNPLIFVDSDGFAPTSLEAALMADHIYRATPAEEGENLGNNFGGWRLSEIYSNNEALRIGVYSRTNGGVREYALVNRGTVQAPGNNNYFSRGWINNFQQPFGNSQDMIDSINFATQFVNARPGTSITMIGHSKGGAEAGANAIATNSNAILFNPAAISLDANELSLNNFTAMIMTFVVDGDFLAIAQRHLTNDIIGKRKYLPSQHQLLWFQDMPWMLERYPKHVINSFLNHSMDAVIQALRDMEGDCC